MQLSILKVSIKYKILKMFLFPKLPIPNADKAEHTVIVIANCTKSQYQSKKLHTAMGALQSLKAAHLETLLIVSRQKRAVRMKQSQNTCRISVQYQWSSSQLQLSRQVRRFIGRVQFSLSGSCWYRETRTSGRQAICLLRYKT